MAIKKYKPTTNGRRGMTTLVNEEITASTPTKSLTKIKVLFPILAHVLAHDLVHIPAHQ